MRKNTERDQAIIDMATSPGGGSYRDIAASIGVTKGVVGAVIFRHRHPDLTHTSRPAKVQPRQKKDADVYLGAPCKRFGHQIRYARDGGCVECAKLRVARHRLKLPKMLRVKTGECPIKKRDKKRRWREKNAEKIAQYQRRYLAKRQAAFDALTELGIEI